MLIEPGKILGQINSPDDIKKLDQTQLIELCSDLRQFIVDNVSVYGGHFGASLGVVELTVALHYVYNTPYDQLVWDVGLPKTFREQIRYLWCRPFIHLYFSRIGDGNSFKV